MNTVNISKIIERESSLAAISHNKKTEYKGDILPLGDLLQDYKKGFEPGSSNYVVESDYDFIRISDLNDYDMTFKLREKIQKILPPENEQPMVYKGDILYQTASNVGNVCIYTDDKPGYYNSHLIKLDFKKDKEYLFAFLKSDISKEQLSIAGSIRGVDNFRIDFLTGLKVVYPTKANHDKPDQVVSYIKDLVNNLIDKEEEAKFKNKLIDDRLVNELENNKKDRSYNFKLPTKSSFIKENRIDTSIFLDEYKKLEFLIESYQYGVYYLNREDIFPGYTPKDHVYSDEKNPTNYLWVTPKNLEQRKLIYKTYIDSKMATKVQYNDIIISGIRYVGNGYYVNSKDPVYANQNTIIIRSSESAVEQRFLLCFLTSSIGRKMQLSRRVMGTVPILYKEQLVRIPIPCFRDEFKVEIANFYFREEEFNCDNEKDYIHYAKKRNKRLGIYQLNEEILILQERLNSLMNKIVNNEKIIFEYDL